MCKSVFQKLVPGVLGYQHKIKNDALTKIMRSGFFCHIHRNCSGDVDQQNVLSGKSLLINFAKKTMRKLSLSELNRLSPEQRKQAETIPLVVVLDNLRSMHNIGSVFRTADAFRIEAVFLCGITAQPPNREMQKTALGATESVNWQYFNTTPEAITYLKMLKYLVVSVEQAEGSIHLNDFLIPENQPIAVILGNEVEGVQQQILDESDFCIEIPQYGTKHSLNVSVTAGIVIWELFNRFTGNNTLKLNK